MVRVIDVISDELIISDDSCDVTNLFFSYIWKIFLFTIPTLLKFTLFSRNSQHARTHMHGGEVATKVLYFGVKSAKVLL